MNGSRLVLILGVLLALDAFAFVKPRRPTAGQAVQVEIPHAGGGGCRVEASVRRESGRGVTRLVAEAKVVGRCRRMLAAGTVWHSVGTLEAGRYVLVTQATARRFVVRPAVEATGPRLAPLRTRIAARWPFEVCPEVGPKEGRARVRRLREQAISFRFVRDATYRYRFRDGCDGAWWTGTASLAPRLEVGPRRRE